LGEVKEALTKGEGRSSNRIEDEEGGLDGEAYSENGVDENWDACVLFGRWLCGCGRKGHDALGRVSSDCPRH
jgi:hypothetical protein